MKKNLILVLFISCNALAQQSKMDSLLSVLKTQREDSAKVNTLNTLCREVKNTGNYDMALQYVNEALALSKKIKFRKGEAKAFNNMGILFLEQGDFREALKKFQTYLKICEEIGYKYGISDSYNMLGSVYFYQGDYVEALKNFQSHLKICEDIDNKVGGAVAQTNIGSIYLQQGNYPQALKNYFAALRIYEETGDKNLMADCYNNIGIICLEQGNYPEALKNYFATLKRREETGDKKGIATSYSNIANVYSRQGNYSDALKNDSISLKIREEIGDKEGIATSYNNIAIIYQQQGNNSEALKNYLATLKITEEIGDKEGMAQCYYNLGSINTTLKKYAEAKKQLDDGLALSKEIGSNANVKSCYRYLAIWDSATGNWKDAYLHHQLFIKYRDSLINEENTKKTVELQMQYEFDKKESLAKAEQDKKDAVALKELQKQKIIRNSFIGAFTTVFVFAIVFFVQRNKISKERKRSDALLLNILPAETAKELKAKGSADAKMFDDVTVMFTDFKDFTQVSEKLTPSELVSEIHYCFKAFDNIMTKFNIEKIKTIGDSYMAAGGLPVENKTNAEDTVLAALEIQKFMLQYKQERQNKNEEYFEIRIGVHTGPVVAGIVGIKKYSYDIWGDTVNIASRMESTCEPGKVNISESTYLLVKDKFPCTYRGKVEAKNKGEIDMYFVEGN